MNKYLKKFFFTIILIISCIDQGRCENLLKGYISNKSIEPIKLKIYNLDKNAFYDLDINLDDNALIPKEGLKLSAENKNSYSLVLNDKTIYIPESTKFIGEVSEIIPEKKFNRSGYYHVSFTEVVCPNGEKIKLDEAIDSKSRIKAYSMKTHAGKTAIGLIGGSALGALLSYKIGGLLLTTATKGYSVAAGAAAGGFIGTLGGIASSGKKASIQPGDNLNIIPVDEISLDKLSQISCSNLTTSLNSKKQTPNNTPVDLEILSVKQKKDFLGELVKVDFKILNRTNKELRKSNFILIDSQGKQYNPSIYNEDDEYFSGFQPKISKKSKIEFFIDHPKATHWLVLKDNSFNKEIGRWKIID